MHMHGRTHVRARGPPRVHVCARLRVHVYVCVARPRIHPSTRLPSSSLQRSAQDWISRIVHRAHDNHRHTRTHTRARTRVRARTHTSAHMHVSVCTHVCGIIFVSVHTRV